MSMQRTTLLVFAPLALAACVSTVEPPPPTETADIVYSSRIYVSDNTRETADTASIRNCAFAGSFSDDTTGTATQTVFFGQYSIPSTDFHNCYVEVKPATLTAEKLTVSNLQYQLCVDSDFCKEPDPSDLDKELFCKDPDRFDECPIVNLSQEKAARYCEWVGRRLPSGFEAIIMRTGGAGDPSDIPEYPRAGGTAPSANSCGDAVLDGCGVTPSPMDIAQSQGAADNDELGGLFDLTGNTREWTRDLMPDNRGAAEGLPWFCQRPVSTSSAARPADDPSWPTTCPAGRTCAFGRVQMADGQILDEVPVCVINESLRLENGSVPTSFGASFAFTPSMTTPRDHVNIGPFVRNLYPEGLDTADKAIGFRCVGVAGEDAVGILEPPGS